MDLPKITVLSDRLVALEALASLDNLEQLAGQVPGLLAGRHI